MLNIDLLLGQGASLLCPFPFAPNTNPLIEHRAHLRTGANSKHATHPGVVLLDLYISRSSATARGIEMLVGVWPATPANERCKKTAKVKWICSAFAPASATYVREDGAQSVFALWICTSEWCDKQTHKGGCSPAHWRPKHHPTEWAKKWEQRGWIGSAGPVGRRG